MRKKQRRNEEKDKKKDEKKDNCKFDIVHRSALYAGGCLSR